MPVATEAHVLDLFERVGLEHYLVFLAQGQPSIAIQLAVVNAALIVFWLLRRVRTRTKTRPSQWLVPTLFTACNLAVLMLGERVAI